jgi:hypothetical protein
MTRVGSQRHRKKKYVVGLTAENPKADLTLPQSLHNFYSHSVVI